jgi:undecaprenyl phosphate N,N'-diacetylbacillosamine 1-phosphate transferase
MYKRVFKRGFDIFCSFICLVILLPFLMLTTIGLVFANHGKPLFIQQRPGKNGQIFKLVKFKTMNDRRDDGGNLLTDEKRITTIGQFIRKYSIDELPQLFNVFKGDMSLVGPRPLLVEYLPLYNDIQKRRHEVRPGITGWAQLMDEMQYPGQKSLNMIFGMWIMSI